MKNAILTIKTYEGNLTHVSFTYSHDEYSMCVSYYASNDVMSIIVDTIINKAINYGDINIVIKPLYTEKQYMNDSMLGGSTFIPSGLCHDKNTLECVAKMIFGTILFNGYCNNR